MTHEHTHSAALWRRIRPSIIAAIILLGVATAHATASEARFVPLPPEFTPSGISFDGSVVVGHTVSPPGCYDGVTDRGSGGCSSEAALWTEAGGVERLGFLREDDHRARAMDVSADGSVIVGHSTSGDGWEAFRWTRESGMVGLGDLPGGRSSLAWGVSGDGSVVVGSSIVDSGEWDTVGFRWTEESGMVGIGDEARRASWNGSVVFGANYPDAFRWTSETGLTNIGHIPGLGNGLVAMSVDGRLIVGSQGDDPRQWTEAGGNEKLPNSTFPWLNDAGPRESGVDVFDMSDDGTYVVGWYDVQDGPRATQDDIVGSFIWDEVHGFRDLHDLLVNDYGLATEMADWTAEWSLNKVTARKISDDGRRIVGTSYRQGGCLRWWNCPQRSWMAILGPPFQPGDANRDDVFNSSDLVQVFQSGQYEDDVAGNSLWKDGDWTLDGDFTSSDLVAAFEAGGYEQGEKGAVIAVPEPASILMLLAGLIGIAMWRTRFAERGRSERIIPKSIFAAIVVLGITTTQATASEARFIPLPQTFAPNGISADGSVLAGWSRLRRKEAALWTETGGIELLGFLPNGDTSLARDISAVGSVVVGYSWSGGDNEREAFRWTRESGMVGLGVLPGQRASYAQGVSGDGSVVVGGSPSFASDTSFWEAFRWTEETGMVDIGGTVASEVSWDGSVIVGEDYDAGRAFRWTSETGLEQLPKVPGDTGDNQWAWPITEAMSVDGRKVVGSVRIATRAWEPRQWTEAGGIELLPNWEATLPWLDVGGPYRSEVHISDMSDDGAVVIGRYHVYEGPDYEPTQDDINGVFIWDEENGIRDLHDLLVNEYGLATEMANWTADWQLYGGELHHDGPAISYDGRRIVGLGNRQGCLPDRWCANRGWLAILGPPYQPGDANRDDMFSSSDLVQVFEVGEYEDDIAGNSLWKDGDWNYDGDFTSGDLVAAFEAGGYELGEQEEAVLAVPEPASSLLLTTSLIGVAIGAWRRPRFVRLRRALTHLRHRPLPAQRSIPKLILASIVVLGITTTHVSASEARFIPLPEDFVPVEISGDGSVVAGWINTPPGCLLIAYPSECDREAALWTEEGGVERLGFLPDDDRSWATDISADGSVLVGHSYNGHRHTQKKAFRWTREHGMVGLGVLPGNFASLARGVSGDGAVVVGTNLDGQSYAAFRWTEESGMVDIGFSTAGDVSWDGSVIIGNDYPGGIRWTTETGVTFLPDVPGDKGTKVMTWPNSYAMSVDGRIFVGTVSIASWWLDEPRQWTEAGGIEMLPNWESTFPWLNDGGPYTSQVLIGDMSDDGSVVVGTHRIFDGPKYEPRRDDVAGAFIWNKEHGFRDLHDLLVNDYGLDTEMASWTAEWSLYGYAIGYKGPSISYDGRRMVGLSFEQGCLSPPNPRDCHLRGWMTVLGPPYQPGDANRDDLFNSSDLVQVFEVGEYEDDVAGNSLWKNGDWNLDGDFTSSDLVAAFEAGGYEQGEQGAVTAVPEPASVVLLMAGLIGVATGARRSIRPSIATGRLNLSRSLATLVTKARCLAYLLVVMTVCTPASHAGLFIGLGDLPGGPFESLAFDISSDGMVIVGESSTHTYKNYRDGESFSDAFRWTRAAGMESLFSVPVKHEKSIAKSVSADGRVIVGWKTWAEENQEDHSGVEAFRWTEADGMEGLGYIDYCDSQWIKSLAYDVSGDGTTIVGTSFNGHASAGCDTEAFRWTEADGMDALGIGHELMDDVRLKESRARFVSHDGSIVVGNTEGFRPETQVAWVWHQETDTMTLLGGLGTRVTAMTSDASIILGVANPFTDDSHPFIWTQETGMEPSPVPGWPTFISDDGTVIVGVDYTEGNQHSYIWTEANGVRPLAEVLSSDFALGDQFNGWNLWIRFGGMSGDGRILTGSGTNPQGDYEAWMAILDESNVHGDFDEDGDLDLDDLGLLTVQVRGGHYNPVLDLSGNSVLDAGDRRIWVKELKQTWFGDANLDGEFNSGDLVAVFRAGEYDDDMERNSTWATGDWNGDGEFNSSDLVAAFEDGGYGQGLVVGVKAVPEPSAALLFANVLCMVPIWLFGRRR